MADKLRSVLEKIQNALMQVLNGVPDSYCSSHQAVVLSSLALKLHDI